MTVSKRVLREVRNLTVNDSTVILNAVQRHVLKQSRLPDPDRDDGVLHPSDMSKAEWCWRHDYYRMAGVKVDPKSQNPSFTMENIFEEGHTIHRKWQGWLREIGVLYGLWNCRECDFNWFDTSPEACQVCLSKRIRYRELPLYAAGLNIAGRADGGLVTADEVFRLLEVKSISLGTLRFEAPDLYQRYLDGDSLDKIWMDIKRPFPTHVRQGTMYAYLSMRSRMVGAPDYSFVDPPGAGEIVFIYEWKPTQRVKEFVVKYNARNVERMIMGAELVRAAREVDQPPKRPQWAQTEDSTVCRSCPYRSTCWHLQVESEPDEHSCTAPSLVVKRATSAKRKKALA